MFMAKHCNFSFYLHQVVPDRDKSQELGNDLSFPPSPVPSLAPPVPTPPSSGENSPLHANLETIGWKRGAEHFLGMASPWLLAPPSILQTSRSIIYVRCLPRTAGGRGVEAEILQRSEVKYTVSPPARRPSPAAVACHARSERPAGQDLRFLSMQQPPVFQNSWSTEREDTGLGNKTLGVWGGGKFFF